NFEYITAARALGLSNTRIIFKHLLPNAMVATLTFMPFILNGSITTLTSLDFLGYGLPVGSPSLGELLAQGKDNLQAPWLGLTAFLVTGRRLTLLILVGEAVRDALAPRKILMWAVRGSLLHRHDQGHARARAGHSHAHGAAHADNERRMGLAALITGAFMFAEIAGGIAAGSLALLADAGHMVTDFASLALAWYGFRLSRRPADCGRT